MAGIGKRMRPHTLSVPKPMLKIAGKSIVKRLVENLMVGGDITEIHYVIGNFGKEVELQLKELAQSNGASGFIHYQTEALGTAHAVYCASEALNGNVVIAFADTLFVGDFKTDDKDDAIIWTKIVDNPEKYGVIKEDENDKIIDFYEKPEKFVSNKAIIGIYYFKRGELLKNEIKNLLDKDIRVGNEYQLTDALKNMLTKNTIIKSKVIDEWLDCGNKDEYLKSCMRIADLEKYDYSRYEKDGNILKKPVFLGNMVEISNSKIGPNVCIEDNTIVENSSLENTVIGNNSKIFESKIINSIIGNECYISRGQGELNIGDHNQYEGK